MAASHGVHQKFRLCSGLLDVVYVFYASQPLGQVQQPHHKWPLDRRGSLYSVVLLLLTEPHQSSYVKINQVSKDLSCLVSHPSSASLWGPAFCICYVGAQAKKTAPSGEVNSLSAPLLAEA